MNGTLASAKQDELEQELLRLWARYLGNSDVTRDDDFFERGGDSLMATELLVDIERLTQRKLPASILFETGTVRLLAERLGSVQLTPKMTVPLGKGAGRPFHYFHGDFLFGGVSVKTFSEMLGRDIPLLAIAPHGLDGRIPDSVEAMAAERVQTILDAQPEGPYILGGHCHGGLVAFETARLLVKAGHRVDLVVIIDPVIVSIRRPVRSYLLARDWIRQRRGVSAEDRRGLWQADWQAMERLDRQVTGYRRRVRNALRRPMRENGEKLLRLLRTGKGTDGSKRGKAKKVRKHTSEESLLTSRLFRVLSAYDPAPISIPVLYAWAERSGGAWRNVSSDTELVEAFHHHLPGENLSAPAMQRIRSRISELNARYAARSAGLRGADDR